jgi:hypothetical protein
MADEPVPTSPTGDAVDAVPSAPAIDPEKFAELQRFHDTYSGYVAGSEPYANTINRIIGDPEFRNLVDSASRAREALAPQDDTPEWARKTREDVEAVRKDLETEKLARAQQAAITAAQNRIITLAQQYPAIAENDYKIAHQVAEKLKTRGITMDQFVDTLEAIAPELVRPAEAAKKPPTSTRADAGIPASTPSPTETFANNKERGKSIDKRLSALLKNVK